MIYLAQPYSDPDSAVRQTRYELACITASRLYEAGFTVYSPIMHWHPTALAHNLPKEARYWDQHNFHMLKLATAIFVLKIAGWKKSVGLKEELHHARAYDLPTNTVDLIIHLDKTEVNWSATRPSTLLEQTEKQYDLG